MNITADELSPALLVVIVVLTLADLGFKAWALVDLIPREPDAIRWRNRWVWLAVILLVNMLGPLVYLAVGRVRPPLTEEAAADLVARPPADRARAAVDLLYGPVDGEGS